MYKSSFGIKGQMRFASDNDYYEFLGYLCKNDGSTSLVWEPNDEQGAWGPEGRIQFHVDPPVALQADLDYTRGRGSNIAWRVNCNEFVNDILTNHGFVTGGTQNQIEVRASVPNGHKSDFDRGLTL